jgi:8-oxo-dGTP pyrophosphatase MutT (NUDIX family)
MATNSVNQKIICSGGLFLSADTKRFLFLQRTQLKTEGLWGFVGGKKEPTDITPFSTLEREIGEEIGKINEIRKIIPLEFFESSDQKFQYNTYVLLIDKEFVPSLNNEHSGYAWCSFNQWPKPLHQAVKNSLNNKVIKAKLGILISLI